MPIDVAYRRYLNGYYTRTGFDEKRTYYAKNGSVFTAPACYYCGAPATCEDHTFPLIAVYSYAQNADLMKRDQFFIVPSCSECNSFLGSKVFKTLKMRREYVKQRIRAKYKKFLLAPEWDDSETGGLGYTLQTYVLQFEVTREIAESRLRWPEEGMRKVSRVLSPIYPSTTIRPCTYCGEALEYGTGDQYQKSPPIIGKSCRTCNQMRQGLSDQEFIARCTKVSRYHRRF